MNYIIYDLEATCWMGPPPQGIQEIIEIGALKLNRYGEVIDSFNKFIKPTVNPILSDFCKRLTSIQQEDVNRSKTFPIILEQWQDWIDIYDEPYVLCSWGKFDEDLLRSECEFHQLDVEWLDSSINVKAQYHKMKGRLEMSGLKSVIKAEGFEFSGVHHRAISDAENLAKIFAKYIDVWIV